MRTFASIIAFGLCAALPSYAFETCDYRPSKWAGQDYAEVVAASNTGVAASAEYVKAKGYYTFRHSKSNKLMIGSKQPGPSAAKTQGFKAGSNGIKAWIVRGLNLKYVVPGSAIVGAGIAAYEGACYYLVDDRVTEYSEILSILSNAAENSEDFPFVLYLPPIRDSDNAWLLPPKGSGGHSYAVRKLYIVNGELMHSDWGRNTSLGHLVFTEID